MYPEILGARGFVLEARSRYPMHAGNASGALAEHRKCVPGGKREPMGPL